MKTATYQESEIEFADNDGRYNTDIEWILTPYDTWRKNPHYQGEPGQHPLDEY